MPTPKLDPALAQEAFDAFERCRYNKTEAATSLGLALGTFKNRLLKAPAYQHWLVESSGRDVADREYEAPQLLDSGRTVEDIVTSRIKAFDRRRKAAESRQWPVFHLKETQPFALAFVGDPHLDDNGCNMRAIQAHLNYLSETPGLYGICIGDYTNNWLGRLQGKYANQEVTQDDGWKLAEWFFNHRKPNGQSVWFLLLKGNHDLWSAKRGGGDPLDWMARQDALLEDWRLKFKVRLPDGQEWKIDAAHDFKGHSQWNTLHANQKAANMDEAADFYVSGHKHNWAYMVQEDQHQAGRVYHLLRTRGYKHFDEYASQLGFADQMYAAAITAVIDPRKQGPSRVTLFPEMADAVDWLNYLRR